MLETLMGRLLRLFYCLVVNFYCCSSSKVCKAILDLYLVVAKSQENHSPWANQLNGQTPLTKSITLEEL